MMRPTLFCLAAAALLVTVSPARADLTFNFQDHPGHLGNSQGFTSTGSPQAYQITANGLTINTANNSITGTTDLYVKTSGGDESGLGTNLGSSHEVNGIYAVDLNFSALKAQFKLTSITFTIGSLTGSDSFALYGGSFAGSPIATGSGTVNGVQTVTLTGSNLNFNDFYLKAPSGDVLLDSITVAGSAVPEPASLAMMGLGVVGSLAGYRIKRRKAITA